MPFLKGPLFMVIRTKVGMNGLRTDGRLCNWLGSSDVVRELLMKVEQIHDLGKRVKNVVHDDKVSALHMAGASGIPEVLQLFLDDGAFNPLKLITNDKRSALHFAIDTTTPCMHANEEEAIYSWFFAQKKTFMYKNPILKIKDFASLEHHTKDKKICENDTMDPKSHWRTKEEYGGKMACITMLLQAGIDVWQQDGEKNYAEPGSKASTDVRLWWYERVAQETLEAKKNLNDGGNAISVVAAWLQLHMWVHYNHLLVMHKTLWTQPTLVWYKPQI